MSYPQEPVIDNVQLKADGNGETLGAEKNKGALYYSQEQ